MLINTNELGKEKACTLLLHDYHREYTGVLDDLTQYDDVNHPHEPGKLGFNDDRLHSYVRCQVIWDHFALTNAAQSLTRRSQMTNEEMIYGAFKTIFGPKVVTDMLFDQEPQYLWTIEGYIDGLDRAFTALETALDTTVGGDDDCFDYWPNTMDMLHEFAKDLYTITGSDVWNLRVTELAARVFARSETEGDDSGMLADEWGYPQRWEIER